MTTSLRVSDTTRAHAAALAARAGVSLGTVVERALEEYEKAQFWRETAAALAASSTPGSDPDDALWDRTTGDGRTGD